MQTHLAHLNDHEDHLPPRNPRPAELDTEHGPKPARKIGNRRQKERRRPKRKEQNATPATNTPMTNTPTSRLPRPTTTTSTTTTKQAEDQHVREVEHELDSYMTVRDATRLGHDRKGRRGLEHGDETPPPAPPIPQQDIDLQDFVDEAKCAWRDRVKSVLRAPGSEHLLNKFSSALLSPADRASHPRLNKLPFPTLEEVKAAIPTTGVEIHDLFQTFEVHQIDGREDELDALLFRASHFDHMAGRLFPGALPTADEVQPVVPEQGVPAAPGDLVDKTVKAAVPEEGISATDLASAVRRQALGRPEELMGITKMITKRDPATGLPLLVPPTDNSTIADSTPTAEELQAAIPEQGIDPGDLVPWLGPRCSGDMVLLSALTGEVGRVSRAAGLVVRRRVEDELAGGVVGPIAAAWRQHPGSSAPWSQVEGFAMSAPVSETVVSSKGVGSAESILQSVSTQNTEGIDIGVADASPADIELVNDSVDATSSKPVARHAANGGDLKVSEGTEVVQDNGIGPAAEPAEGVDLNSGVDDTSSSKPSAPDQIDEATALPDLPPLARGEQSRLEQKITDGALHSPQREPAEDHAQEDGSEWEDLPPSASIAPTASAPKARAVHRRRQTRGTVQIAERRAAAAAQTRPQQTARKQARNQREEMQAFAGDLVAMVCGLLPAITRDQGYRFYERLLHDYQPHKISERGRADWSQGDTTTVTTMATLLWQRDLASDAAGVKTTFSSWDSCMTKAYCKWPVIVAIILASLIALSLLWCLFRCLCCGAECCCGCLACCNACCPSPRRGGSKRVNNNDGYYQQPPPQPVIQPYPQYQSAPPPIYAAAGGYRGAQPPQTATFDAPGHKKYNEDALPPMPSWDNATSKHIEDDDVELEKLDHPQAQQQQSLLPHQDDRDPYNYYQQQPQQQAAAAAAAGDLGTMHATPYHDYDQHRQYAASPIPTTAQNSAYPPTYHTSPTSPMYAPPQQQQQQQQQWGTGSGTGGGYAPSVAPSYHTTAQQPGFMMSPPPPSQPQSAGVSRKPVQGPTLRDLLPNLDLKSSLSRLTVSALQKRLEKAKGESAQWLSVGSKDYSFEMVKGLLGDAGVALEGRGEGEVVLGLPESRSVDGGDSTGDVEGEISSAVVSKEGAGLEVDGVKRKASSMEDATANLEVTPSSESRETKRQRAASPNGEMPDAHEQGASSSKASTDPSATKPAERKPRTPRKPDTPAARRAKMSTIESMSLAEAVLYTDAAEFEASRARQTKEKARQAREKAAARKEAKVEAEKKKEVQSTTEEEKSSTKTTAEAEGQTVPAKGVVLTAEQRLAVDIKAADEQLKWYREVLRERTLLGERSTKYYSRREDIFTDEQKANLKALAKTCPRYLYHVHSTNGQRHTRGSASEQQMQPAAAVDNNPLHASIYAFPTLSSLIINFGHRILWDIRKADQFTSYTTSLLFALVHALGRETRGETGITISLLDTRLARDPTGAPAEFCYVPDLKKHLGVLDWVGWSDMPLSKLRSPWYTHEYVAHGVVDLDPGSAMRKVPFEDFVSLGLYEFAPGLYEEEEEAEMRKLYNRCLQLRYLWYHPRPRPIRRPAVSGETAATKQLVAVDGETSRTDLATTTIRAATPTDQALAAKRATTSTHPRTKPTPEPPTRPPQPPKPFNLDFLNHAARLARLFNPFAGPPEPDAPATQEIPPTHPQVFLDLVGLSNRQKNDEVFTEYIRTHFTAPQVQDLLYPSMNRIPCNLPETMQSLDRLREACASLGVVPGPGGTEVAMVDVEFDIEGVWHGEIKRIRARVEAGVSEEEVVAAAAAGVEDGGEEDIAAAAVEEGGYEEPGTGRVEADEEFSGANAIEDEASIGISGEEVELAIATDR
ncbi:hypothetical protein B0A55_09191 [Friedmanniomyces simplex]|uniref:Uncharacterized protein n=1 Tax=Friedmanniomyces simplex TaxID=329884 RepID=A0A4V5NEM2_9PEZI|nr:hypothetical protein B0A55_09191 [Friedmanniomyces simplex]